jgi:hypothetical protein
MCFLFLEAESDHPFLFQFLIIPYSLRVISCVDKPKIVKYGTSAMKRYISVRFISSARDAYLNKRWERPRRYCATNALSGCRIADIWHVTPSKGLLRWQTQSSPQSEKEKKLCAVHPVMNILVTELNT